MSALNEPTIATDELRPTRIEVDLDVLAENYGAIAAHVAPARVMPILKANAYGHGLVEVGRVVERLRAPYIGVAYLEEGLRLRQHGVRLPVLVLGRSEEHTSELQSPCNLVCRLLLEKKKKIITQHSRSPLKTRHC